MTLLRSGPFARVRIDRQAGRPGDLATPTTRSEPSAQTSGRRPGPGRSAKSPRPP